MIQVWSLIETDILTLTEKFIQNLPFQINFGNIYNHMQKNTKQNEIDSDFDLLPQKI